MKVTHTYTPSGVESVATSTDRAELDAWIARYLREYSPWGYGTTVRPMVEGPDGITVRIWRADSCE